MNLKAGQPFLNLDPYFDIPEFEKIVDSLILGVTRSLKYRIVARSGPPSCLLDKLPMDVSDQLNIIQTDQNSSDLKLFNDHRLSLAERLQYVKLKYNVSHLNEVILLRSTAISDGIRSDEKNVSLKINQSYYAKSSASNTSETEAAQNFAPFMQWIYKQSFFSEVGRVIVFLTSRGENCLVHRDYSTNKSDDEFVWINPLAKKKKFFVLDEKTQTKHYLTGTFNYFDNSNYHGSENSEHDTLSIRIDGRFSPETKKRIGL